MPGISNTLAQDLMENTTDIAQVQSTDILPIARPDETVPHYVTPDEITDYVEANATTFVKDLTAPTMNLSGNNIRIQTTKTPANASATGTKGTICWDASYLYICVDTDTWKRVGIDTWGE